MKIVVFTGAGMSAESGIMTFRDDNGIWRENDWHELATPESFHKIIQIESVATEGIDRLISELNLLNM